MGGGIIPHLSKQRGDVSPLPPLPPPRISVTVLLNQSISVQISFETKLER